MNIVLRVMLLDGLPMVVVCREEGNGRHVLAAFSTFPRATNWCRDNGYESYVDACLRIP